MGTDIKAVGVSGNKGALGDFTELPEACVIQVGHVDDDPVYFQLLDRLFAQSSQPCFTIGTAGQFIFLVPGQGQNADTQFPKFRDALQLAAQRRAVFHREHGVADAFPDVFRVVGNDLVACGKGILQNFRLGQKTPVSLDTAAIVVDKGGKGLHPLVKQHSPLHRNIVIIVH